MKKTITLLALALLTGINSYAQNKASKKCNAVASFGTHTGTSEITKADLSNVKEITIKNECTDNAAYMVVSYEVTVVKDGNVNNNNTSNVVVEKGAGPFSKEIMEAFKNASSGGKVFLDNVKVKAADGVLNSIPGITLKIK